MVDTEFFRALSPLEFVGLEWNRSNKDLLARNVNGWTDWFNRVLSLSLFFLFVCV